MKRWLGVRKYTPRNSRLRLVEGHEDRQMNLADNGELWWFLRNAVQLPGFGRSMTIFEQADRANLGVIETITDLLRNLRISLEKTGLVDEVSDQFVEGDTASPAIGKTRFDEALSLGGVRVHTIKNLEQIRRELLRENSRMFNKLHPQSQNKYEQRREREIKIKRK